MKTVKQHVYPPGVEDLARRRIRPLLKTMTLGNSYRLDLAQIAASCYLQGMVDAAELVGELDVDGERCHVDRGADGTD